MDFRNSRKHFLLVVLVTFLSVIFGFSQQMQAVQTKADQTLQTIQLIPISIEHKNNSIIMRIDNPRPLNVAVDFFRLKYGWIIDYEEPPFISELIDAGDPIWRASHQPAPSPGTLVINGGKFQTEYEEYLAKSTTKDGEKQILEKIVADYNKSGNPGKFAVLQESEQRYSVVGISVKDMTGKNKDIIPILDTLITIPNAERSAWDTVNLILTELSRQTSKPVIYFAFADNGLMQSKVVVGGEKISARTMLLQTLGGNRAIRDWGLLYDANRGGNYVFNTGGYSIAYAPQ